MHFSPYMYASTPTYMGCPQGWDCDAVAIGILVGMFIFGVVVGHLLWEKK